MPDIIVTVPAPIVVQVKQVGKTEVISPSVFSGGGSTRLTQLLDVDVAGQKDGFVLSFNSNNNNYVMAPVDGGTF